MEQSVQQVIDHVLEEEEVKTYTYLDQDQVSFKVES
jgi:hypothetical protein